MKKNDCAKTFCELNAYIFEFEQKWNWCIFKIIELCKRDGILKSIIAYTERILFSIKNLKRSHPRSMIGVCSFDVNVHANLNIHRSDYFRAVTMQLKLIFFFPGIVWQFCG